MLCLIQFSAVLLAVNSDFDCDAVLRSRRRRIRLLAVAVQPLRLDDGREILVADIEIDVAVDACDLAFLGMLPNTVCAGVIRLVTPVCQPDSVVGLDVIGGMCRERGCRTVQPDKIARCLHSFKERPHNGRHLFLAEVELFLLLQIEIYRELELLSLDDRQEHIRLHFRFHRCHCIGIPVSTDRNTCCLCACIILLEAIILLRCKPAVSCSQDCKVNACRPDLLPVDLSVMNADVDALHILTPEILVKIIGHRAVTVNLITVPLAAGANINVRIDVGGSDICNAVESGVLRLAADRPTGNRLTVLPVTADVRRLAACMLSRAAALDCLIMSSTTEPGGHDDLGTVQRRIERLQLGDEIIVDLKIMCFAAFTAELLRIKVRRELCIIGIAVGLNHPYHPFCRSASAEPQWHFSVREDTEYP